MMALGVATRGPRSLHCDLDDWDFNPQLTEGACPICGWAPAGALVPPPAWIQALGRVQWDFVMLILLAAVLVTFGVLVAQSAHIFGGH